MCSDGQLQTRGQTGGPSQTRDHKTKQEVMQVRKRPAGRRGVRGVGQRREHREREELECTNTRTKLPRTNFTDKKRKKKKKNTESGAGMGVLLQTMIK